MHRFAGVVVDVLLGPDQIVRHLHRQHLAQLLGVIVRLGEDQALDQRAFEVPCEGHLIEQHIAVLQFRDEIPRHAPPRRRRAVHRVHHRFEAQRRIQRVLQDPFQRLAHGGAGDHHLKLAAVTGDRQHLAFIRRNDHPLIAVGLEQRAVLAQLLLAHQRQAEAVAAEVFGVFNVDGHIGAVLDRAQGGGHGLEHIGAVMKADPLRRRGFEAMRTADPRHPGPGPFKVIVIDTNIAKLRISFATHHGAPTAIFFSARSDGAPLA
ncbi:hypothetical protein D3C78_1111720 [compost metagenome]